MAAARDVDRVELDRAQPTQNLEHAVRAARERPRRRQQLPRNEKTTRVLLGDPHLQDATATPPIRARATDTGAMSTRPVEPAPTPRSQSERQRSSSEPTLRRSGTRRPQRGGKKASLPWASVPECHQSATSRRAARRGSGSSASPTPDAQSRRSCRWGRSRRVRRVREVGGRGSSRRFC